MDGWVTIGTRLDTKQLKQDLKNAENELKGYERNAEKLTKQKEKAEINLQAYEEEKRLIKESTDELLRYAQTSSEVENTLQLENTQLQALDSKYATQINKVEEINNKIKENAYNQGLANNKVEELNNKLGKVKGFDSIKNSMNDVGKSIEKTIKKVGRWALAVFGIRSAYMAVRNAINVISSNDEQLKADIDYMKNAIAYTLEPLVRGIVNLAKQLMFYVAYIIKAWTGKNIFANANKSLQSANKQAEKLSKTLAGFDEMNVLEDQSSSDGGGAVAPSFDLTDLEGMEVPKWLQWIVDNKDAVLGFFGTLGVLLVALKLGEFLQTLGLFSELPLWQLVGGLALIIGGIALAIKGVIDFIEEPSWNNFLTILQGIALVVAGISVLMGNWLTAAIALGVALVTYVIQNWDKIKEILGVVGTWIYDHIIKPVGDFFSNLWNGIKEGASKVWNWLKDIVSNVFNGIKNTISGLWEWIKNSAKSVVTWVGNIFKSIVELFRNIGTKVGDAISGAFKSVINGVLWAVENILNTPIRTINGLIGVINKIPGINIGYLSEFRLPRLAKGGIVNNPGAGVMMGSYVAGERGPEAVIPLDDATLDRLGLAFARHTNINATIPVYVGNRQIAREIRKIDAEDNFAFNG